MTKAEQCLSCGVAMLRQRLGVEWASLGVVCETCLERHVAANVEAQTSAGVWQCLACEYETLRGQARFFGAPRGTARGLCSKCAKLGMEVIVAERRRRAELESPRFNLRSIFVTTSLVAILFALLRLVDFATFWVLLAAPWVVVLSASSVWSFFQVWWRKKA